MDDWSACSLFRAALINITNKSYFKRKGDFIERVLQNCSAIVMFFLNQVPVAWSDAHNVANKIIAPPYFFYAVKTQQSNV